MSPIPGRHRPPTERATKTCPQCHKPFSWRKKWARVWDEVKYCSEKCKRAA
jgi:hypothetical protein